MSTSSNANADLVRLHQNTTPTKSVAVSRLAKQLMAAERARLVKNKDIDPRGYRTLKQRPKRGNTPDRSKA